MRIFLVRHGQSKSNLDWTENQRVADHAIELSEEGHLQAKTVGTFLNDYLHDHLIAEYRHDNNRPLSTSGTSAGLETSPRFKLRARVPPSGNGARKARR